MISMLRDEFKNYSLPDLQRDTLAGITVAAVALPLALAFGVASGADAAAGLVTAILAGFVIGALGGSGTQISGPTGAMSAVLIVLANRYGLEGVWMAGVLAGFFVLLMGVFDLGRIVNFIPTTVIAGFTSGIALIIFIGQIDNLLGVHTAPAENSLIKLVGYLRFDTVPNLTVIGLSLLVILITALWPPQWNARFPGSLLALIVATALTSLLRLDVPMIGDIPRTLLLDKRLTLAGITWEGLGNVAVPALSIAVLGAIESLLCGAVAGRMTGQKLASRQELIAQGIGNILIPFFGGVPATAAIARSSVAIKSGGRTRVVSLIHALALLLAALVLAPMIARVPLAGLAGVLVVTSWRMNEWTHIQQIFVHRQFKSGILTFVATLAATVALDLTEAILIGVALSALIFVMQISQSKVTLAPVSVEKLRASGYDLQYAADQIVVAYVTGPLFFGTTNTFDTALEGLGKAQDIILSLRTVPLIDTTGIHVLEEWIERIEGSGRRIYLSGLNDPVREYLERGGILKKLGEDRVFWSAYEAILAADHYRARVAPHEA